MLDVIAQRFCNCILQQLLIELQSLAVNRDYLRPIEIKGHNAYQDQDAGNEIEQRYTVG
jgi:hypothetical protein